MFFKRLVKRSVLHGLLLTVSASCIAQTHDSKYLDQEDTTANDYIKNSLNSVPEKEPVVRSSVTEAKAKLIRKGENAQAKLTPSLPSIESTKNLPIPDVKSVDTKKDVRPEELFELLAAQTGLSESEIRRLFEGRDKSLKKTELSPTENVTESK